MEKHKCVGLGRSRITRVELGNMEADKSGVYNIVSQRENIYYNRLKGAMVI